MTQSELGEKRSRRSVGHAGPRETTSNRLREAGLDTERFIALRDGTKESYTDHTDPRNQHAPDIVDGNYGVLAGDGLVILDLDTYREDIDGVPDPVESLPATFTGRSPHGGEHRFYAVEGNVSNAKHEWGEVRAENQYVVGPGSQLDGCGKDWCDGCETAEGGRYQVLHDRPIATIRSEALPDKQDLDTSPVERDDQGLPDSDDAPADLKFNDIEAPFDVQARWKALLESEHADTVEKLCDGRYRDANYVADDGTGDRSDAEWVLLEHLGWWMDDEKSVVAKVMNRICVANPNTDGGRRKWLERDDEYRKDRLASACNHPRTYEKATDWPTLYGDDRPVAGGPIQERVLDALMKTGIASTAELIEHDRVDRSRRQVRRALDKLEEKELVDSIKDPEDRRRVLYYSTIYESKLPKLLEDRS